eukprot:gene2654-3851_t
MNWESRVLGNIWNLNSEDNLSRINHSGCIISKVLYIFGGTTETGDNKEEITNTMIKYFLNSGEYEILENESYPFLSFHSCNYYEEEKAIYFFGGIDGFEKPQNHLYKFDLKNETFEKVPPKGTAPKPRYGHTTTLVNGYELYIIGGTDGSTYFNDIHIFDLKTKQFHHIDYKGNFIARAHHTTILYEMNLFIFGGGNDNKIFNDIQCIDIAQMKNQQIQPTSNGITPTQKMSHSSEIIGNKMIVFGGQGKFFTNEVLVFDLETFIWEKIPIKDNEHAPPPLFGHVMICSSSSKLCWIFGGKNIQNFSDDKIFCLDTAYQNIEPIEIPKSTLPRDLLFMINNEDFKDISFEVENDEIIHANRAIFRFRCPLLHKICVKLQYLDEINFQIILSMILKKEYTDIVYYKTLSSFLEFIYSDMIVDLNDLNEKEFEQLIYFSDIFNLKRLNSILLDEEEMEDILIPPPTIQEDLFKLYNLAQELDEQILLIGTSDNDTNLKSKPSDNNTTKLSDNNNENMILNTPISPYLKNQISLNSSPYYSSNKPLITTTNENVSSISTTSTNFSSPEFCYSDLTFKIGNNENIYVHRFIIESRLKNNSLDKLLNEEDLENINPNVFKTFIQYLYFDHKINIDFDISIELMILAEDYGLYRLSKMCQSVIEKKICIHNASKILQISDHFDIMHLRKYTIYFIIYHFSSIKKKYHFKELDKELKDEILELKKELISNNINSIQKKKRKKEKDMTSYVKSNSKIKLKK